MPRSLLTRRFAARAPLALVAVAALVLPAGALAAKAPPRGALTQLPKSASCLADRSAPSGSCGSARALKGAGVGFGSRAIAVSPDGRNVYVAASKSNAIAIFRRDPKTGRLTQPKGPAGCIASQGAGGCAPAIGLEGPNSVAVSPDGRSVYATSRGASSLTVFARNPKGGGLTQLPAGFGCISGLPVPVCSSGRALIDPDVVVISPDGRNVYAGAFAGNGVVTFNRDPASGALAQPSGTTGCIAEAVSGCAVGIGLGAIEGLAVTSTGVYTGSAASNAVAVLARDPTTGALAQATDGSGCLVATPLSGCTNGYEFKGANAVAVSPGGKDVYVTSLLSNSVTTFTRAIPGGGLTQKTGTAGCLVWLRAPRGSSPATTPARPATPAGPAAASTPEPAPRPHRRTSPRPAVAPHHTPDGLRHRSSRPARPDRSNRRDRRRGHRSWSRRSRSAHPAAAGSAARTSGPADSPKTAWSAHHRNCDVADPAGPSAGTWSPATAPRHRARRLRPTPAAAPADGCRSTGSSAQQEHRRPG